VIKKLFLVAGLLLCFLPAHAVLKERDLARTLGVLRLELENNYKQQKNFMERYERMSKQQHNSLVEYMKKSEQISLMLYSQKSDFTFDVAYACQQATDLYKALHKTNMPYEQIRQRLLNDVARYDSLIVALKQLPPPIDATPPDSLEGPEDKLLNELLPDSLQEKPEDDLFMLNNQEQVDREQCITYAQAMRNNLLRFLISLSKDYHHYQSVSDQVGRLNDYAQKRYEELQQSIFQNGGKNYIAIMLQLPQQVKMSARDISEKYFPLENGSTNYSEWRGPIVLGMSVFMIIYILAAILIANLIMNGIPWLMKKIAPKFAAKTRSRFDTNATRTMEFKRKKWLITIVVGIAIFAIVIMLLRNVFYNNLFKMAASLMATFSWLLEAVLISFLIRLKGKQIKHGIRLYTPFILMAFLVIVFRIVLIPNSLVNLIYPPILLLFVLWQISCQKKNRDHMPAIDTVFSGISLGVMVVGCALSWLGYTLMAVQLMIWWMFQLAAIQTIICLYYITDLYEKHLINKKISLKEGKKDADDLSKKEYNKLVKRMRSGEFFSVTWLLDFIRMAVLPTLAVFSVLMCINLAADLFEMNALVRKLFFYNFVDEKGVLQLSLFKLCLVVAFYFLFRYINYACKSYYQLLHKRSQFSEKNMNDALVRNVIAVLVWGSYFIFALVLLQVPKSGISIVTAGLATGMGFAMKDLLENFFYGISLMTGRVRVGDYIECDGVQGKVDSITYQSTQVQTLDGSIIAFLNSSLFNKNFKNLTRNHGYVLVKIPVGVAYGTNIDEVRKILIEALDKIRTKGKKNVVHPERPIQVIFSEFGASSVDLLVYAWVLVEEKTYFMADAREVIYNVLNQHAVEIPFPQQDVYIKKIVETSK